MPHETPRRRAGQPGRILRITVAIEEDAAAALRSLLHVTVLAEKGRAQEQMRRAGMDLLDADQRRRHQHNAELHRMAAVAIERLFFGLNDAVAGAGQWPIREPVRRAYELANNPMPETRLAGKALRLLRLECETLRHALDAKSNKGVGAFDLPPPDVIEEVSAATAASRR